MRKIILIIGCLSCYYTINACYNESHYDKKGKPTERYEPFSGFYHLPDTARANEYIKEHPLSRITAYDWEMQSDIAVNLAYLGRPDESLQILSRLQRAMPNEYMIAANLGTTYELLGKNDSALFYIKKGIELNPESHKGSEWVHVKILEAKLALAKDANWLATHSVLGTGVQFSSARSEKYFQYASQVEYQLQERVPFTPFPDKLLANVFNEWGDLLATQQSIAVANIAYQFALINDESDPYDVKSKLDWIKAMMKKNKMPITDWTEYYTDRNGNPAGKESFKKIAEAMPATKGDNATKPAAYIRGGNTKGTNKTFIYILAIACTLLVAYLAVYLYRQKLHNRGGQV